MVIFLLSSSSIRKKNGFEKSQLRSLPYLEGARALGPHMGPIGPH